MCLSNKSNVAQGSHQNEPNWTRDERVLKGDRLFMEWKNQERDEETRREAMANYETLVTEIKQEVDDVSRKTRTGSGLLDESWILRPGAFPEFDAEGRGTERYFVLRE